METLPDATVDEARRLGRRLGKAIASLQREDVETLSTWLAGIVARTAEEYGDDEAGVVLYNAVQEARRGFDG